MGNEAFELARAQMIGAINASSGPEQRMYQQNLAILENIGSMQDNITVFARDIDRIKEVQANLFEYCKQLNAQNKALKERIEALEQKPVKKGLFG